MFMLISPFNPRSAPTQPASVPVRGIARVTQMLGRVANRVRTALTRTKATTHPPEEAPKEAKAPTRRTPKTTPAPPHLDDDLFAEFCTAETIGEIFASFCRILNIDERSPLYPAKLIALTQTPEEFAATRKQDSAPTPPARPNQATPPAPNHRAPLPPSPVPPATQRTAPPRPPTQPRRTQNHPTPPIRPPTRALHTHGPPQNGLPPPTPNHALIIGFS